MVKERLGHGSIRTTERYLHCLPSKADAALTALAATRGTASVASAHDSPLVEAPDAAEVLSVMAKIKELYDKLGADNEAGDLNATTNRPRQYVWDGPSVCS